MTDEITLASPSLDDFLDRLGLPQRERKRLVAIDRALADELEKDNLDADGCAELVFRAADLIANSIPLGFDWSGWDGDAEPDDLGGFDLDGMELGEEGSAPPLPVPVHAREVVWRSSRVLPLPPKGPTILALEYDLGEFRI